MANINYSSEYETNSKLFKLIKEKHDADFALPAGSVLTQFFNEQGIDLAIDLLDVIAADAADVLSKKKEKDAENLKQQRDNLFNPAFSQHRGMVQFMKKLKRGKVHELGDWGQTVNGVDRIDYPTEFAELKKCMKDFIDKHNTFPVATSPLKPYLDAHPEIDLVQTLLDLASAETRDTDFKQANKDMETQTELRDTKFDTPYEHVRGIGQYLTGIFDKNLRKLGDWGFVIDDAARKEKVRMLTISEEEAKTVHDAVLGSVVENKGTVTVQLFAGKTTDGTPVILEPNQKFVIKFRYGTFTTLNPSVDGKALIQATVSK